MFFTNSVETLREVEMQKGEEKSPRKDQEVQTCLCGKTPEGPTVSEKRAREMIHMPFRAW